MLIGDLTARFTVDALQWSLALGKATTEVQNFEKSVQRSTQGINQSFQNMAGMLTRYLGPAALIAFGARVIAVNDNLSDLADRTGFSASTLSGLRTTLENAGLSVETFARGMQFAQRSLGDIDKDTDKTAVALKKLNLNAQELQAMNVEDMFETIGKALSGVSNQTERLSLQSAIFQRAGVSMGNTLGDIGKNFAQLKTSGLNEETVRILGELGDLFNTLKNKVMDFVAVDMVQWFRSTAVEAAGLIQILIKLVDGFVAFQESLPKLNFQQKIVDAVKGLKPTLEGAAKSLDEFSKKSLGVWGDQFDKFVDRWAAGDAALKAGPKGMVDDDAQKKIEALTKSLQGQIIGLTALEKGFTEGQEAADRFKVTEEALAALEGGKLTPAHRAQIEVILQLMKSTKDYEQSLKDANKAVEDFKKNVDEAAEADKKWIEQNRILSQLSLTPMEQELAKIEQKYKDIAKAAAEAIKAGKPLAFPEAVEGGGGFKNINDFLDFLSRQEQLKVQPPDFAAGLEAGDMAFSITETTQVIEEQRKRAEELTKTWEGMFDSISSGMASTLEGVMQGTQSVGEAFRNMGRNIALALAQIVIQLGILNPLKNAIFGGEQGFTPGMTLGKLFGKFFGSGGGGSDSFGLAGFDWGVFEFQHGGTVPGRKGQAVPIMAHAGEKIIPLSHADKEGGGVSVIIRGGIVPERPNMGPKDVVQVMMNDFDNRGPATQLLEQRMSPRR